MRRRRPSALYSVLDEEQLLDGVDLTDYPDPLEPEVSMDPAHDDDPPEEWTGSRYQDVDPGEWSPEGAVEPAGSGATWQAARRSEPEPQRALNRRRRPRLLLGFVGAAVLVVLLARGLAEVLADAGERAGSRRTAASATVGALSAVAKPARGGGAPASTAGPQDRPPAVSPASSAPVHHARPPRRTVRRGRRPTRPQLPGEIGSAGSSRRVVERGTAAGRPVAVRSPPVDLTPGTPATGSADLPRPPRSASPEQEFGFER